jgi:type VI secretion system protein ImpL
MLKRFSSFMRTLIVAGILALFAVILVWFLGPRLDLSSRTILLIIAGILVLLLLILLLQFVISRQGRARGTVRDRSSQSDHRQGTRELEEAVVLGERLDHAIRWLKKSKLAESGRDAVYDLPWYLLVGLKESGKSTLVVQSGFSFSYTDPKKAAGKLNFGPTDSCDLWVANEALFIDPSGKHFAENQDTGPCLNMLRQIKERRQQKPVDGLLLVVDVAKLLSTNDVTIRAQADRFRTFLDMTMHEFGMVIPIYLLFNKSDLIEGFQEFFSKPLDRENQVLGATFTKDQYEDQNPEKVFQQEFNQICHSAWSFGLARLIGESQRVREKTFTFPKQLLLMKDRLSEFIGILFQHSQFREKPLFRGFYFTSGVQQERHLDLVADLLSSKVGLPVGANPEGTQGTESYFIKSLLTRVILPDRNLAGLSSAIRRRRLLMRMAFACTVGMILPLVITLFFWGAYRDNDGLIAAVERAGAIPIENGKSSKNLQDLNELRESLETFDCHGEFDSCETSGRRFNWGLYAGDTVLAKARSVFMAKLNQLFLDQLINGDETLGHKYNGLKTQLRMMAAASSGNKGTGSDFMEYDPGRAYTLLKTILMLSDANKASPAFLRGQLLEYWRQGVQEKDESEAMALLKFYLHQLGDHHNASYSLPTAPADKELAKSIRNMLLVVEPDLYYYRIIQEEGNRKLNLINLTGIVGVENTKIFDAGAEVDGTYTKVGWETLVRDRIGAMKADYEVERSWVLGTMASEPGQAKIDEELRTRYFRDYQDNWWNFLKSIDIVPFTNFQDASQKLVVLGDNRQSPIAVLLKATSLNTWEESAKKSPTDAESLKNDLHGGTDARSQLAEAFRSIHDFVKENGKQDSSLIQYLKTLNSLQVAIKSFLDAGQPAAQIQDIGKEAESALRVTNGLLVSFDAKSRESIESLLKQPIQHVISLVDKAMPVGAVQERKSTLIVGGIVRDKDKTRKNTSVSLLEMYEDDQYQADKEIMKAKTGDGGAFKFSTPINPGTYKICVSENKDDYYCGDVRLMRENNGKVYELKRSRSMLLFGGGKRQLTLNIR